MAISKDASATHFHRTLMYRLGAQTTICCNTYPTSEPITMPSSRDKEYFNNRHFVYKLFLLAPRVFIIATGFLMALDCSALRSNGN